MCRIREPDKEPNQLKLATYTEEFYPHLIQAIREIKAQVGPQLDNIGDIDCDDDVVITTVLSRVKEDMPNYIDSSPPPPNYIDSSDVESNAGSIDSIQRNANFVSF